MRVIRSTVFVLALILAATAASAGTIIPFSPGFDHTVTVDVVSPADTLAIFKQDPATNVVALWNDPSPVNSHPPLIVAQTGMTLLFDYVLYEFGTPQGNTEQLWAGLTDSSTGAVLGVPYEVKRTMGSSGTVSFDLSGLSGQTVGIRFEMRSDLADPYTNGHLNVSNLRTALVPVPAAFLLALPPLCALLIWRRIRRRKPR